MPDMAFNRVVVQVINAFTDNGLGGNPAGVVFVMPPNLGQCSKTTIRFKKGVSA
jgi:predicted PhzF superfamily epimerase YddE/YHI9